MARKWFTTMAAVAVALSTTLVLAQTPAAPKETAEHKQKMTEKMAMMAKMTAADQKIADLVAKMNAANGEEKIAAMTAVVNELVAQRKQMHESCGMMKATAEPAKGAGDTEHADHHPAQ